MGQCIRETDWSATPLGAYTTWPQSLRSTLSLVLNAKGIAALYWGAEQWLLYNDAYGAALGDRHPWAFGRRMPEVLSDIAPVLGPQVAEVLRTGEGFAIENLPLTMRRDGQDEETIWTYSFSPVQGETGAFAGVLLLATEITQQKAAEQAEKQAKLRLETALRVARLGTFDWHPSTGIIGVDARGREMFDLPLEGVLRQEDTFGRIAREDVARVQADASVVMGIGHPFDSRNLGRTIDLSYDLVHADGLRRSIVSSGVIVENPDGTRRMVGTFNDVTELKQAETRLQEKNATLEHQVEERTAERNRIWQVSRDMLMVSDLAGVFLNVNPAWTRVLGWTAEELVGRTSEWLEHPDDREETRAEIVRLAESGAPTLAFENRFRTRDGDYRHLSWTAAPKGDRFYCVARDITEAHEQAKTLRRSEQRALTYFDFSNDYLFLVRIGADGATLFDDMNPACARVMGLVRAEVTGRLVDAVLPENSAADIVRYARRCLETKEPQTYLAEREYQDGHKLTIEGRVAFVERSSHGGGLVLFSGHDVTEQRGVEEALRQSQKMEAVGQLTGGLAHDFNNLLAGISGSLELMQARMQQGRFNDVERYMAAAQGASKRAAALTHRLLAFSRRQTLAPKPTDVNRLVNGMQEMIQRTVGPGIPVEVVGASSLWTALVDPPQLENALLNLCINARDAMPDGGRITVETHNKWIDERASRKLDMPEGQYLSLCVTDTGTGMPPEVIARVFEPFFTTKPIGEGTGLGLSMIYGFAQQSGGQVRIYSEVGQGTTICIYLPRHYGEAADEDGAIKLDALPRSGQDATVLIVDDEPTVRMLVTDILEDLGYLAIEAGDSAAGLKILQSDVRIDLLVTDVGLPGGMNGRQMADAGRVSRPDLRVLFITGYAENAILGNGCLAPGMTVMTKPFAMDEMATRIRSLVEAGGEGKR